MPPVSICQGQALRVAPARAFAPATVLDGSIFRARSRFGYGARSLRSAPRSFVGLFFVCYAWNSQPSSNAPVLSPFSARLCLRFHCAPKNLHRLRACASAKGPGFRDP